MIENLLIIVAVIFTIIAAYTDIRWRIAPDYLSYSMIIFGLIGNLFLSIIHQTPAFFLYSISIAIIVFSVGYIASYFGLWGMGDTKILTGYAAIFSLFPATLAPWPFVITIWLNSLLIAPLLAIIYIVYRVIKYRHELLPKIQQNIYSNRKITLGIAVIFTICIIVYLTDNFIGGFLLIGWALSTVFYYILVIARLMDKNIYEIKKPAELIEGDYPLENIKFPGKLKKWGLEKTQIEYIKKHYKKPLKIKLGFPMIVAYFFSLVISIRAGDLLYKLLLFITSI